jgi:hypothetical protein
MSNKYSDYIIYVDESGDHSLTSVDKDYPMFVLAFCIFKKDLYTDNAVRKLKELKFKHFGHDMVVLHENEIRRDKGFFKILKSKEMKQSFMDELTTIIEEEEFTIIATAIKKENLFQHKANNPYDLALRFCMERAYSYLKQNNQDKKITHIVVEKRGQKEDAELELEFRRINSGQNQKNIIMNFEIIMAHKQSNSAGLQLADLVARPIGISILKPEQENRAYEIIEKKFYKKKEDWYLEYGLKIYP